MNSTSVFPSLAAARNATDSSALDHLAATVKRLVRAERRQALTHYGLAGLFWGIAAACAAVLLIRLVPLPVSVAHATFVCILTGTAIGLAAAWYKRRSTLAVAILADIRLNLQQRLSSAWELYEKDTQSVMAAGIARQLLRTRTPVAHHVFPLSARSANPQYTHPGIRWGRLLPVVALLLLLLNTLNFAHLTGQPGVQLDSTVQHEGTTLRKYGASMALRAREANLKQSAQIGDTMRQLGRRMEGGTLARGAALDRLNELRADINKVRQRLVPRIGAGNASHNGDAVTAGESERERARSVIENAVSELADGSMSASELHEDTALQRALETAAINPDAFRKALEDAGNGNPQSLEKMLQEFRRELHNDDRAARDAQALERAYERVQSTRENLGAQPEAGSPAASARGLHSEDDFIEEHEGLMQGQNGESPDVVFQERGRPGGLASASGSKQNDASSTAPVAAPDSDQPSVRPKGKISDGGELVTQTRIAPKLDEVTTATQAVEPQQQQQLEAILSKDTLPAHQKAYVRRYFLELSRAVNATIPPAVDEPVFDGSETDQPGR